MKISRPAIDRRAPGRRQAGSAVILGPQINLLPKITQLRQRLHDRVRQWGVVLAVASVMALLVVVTINAGAYADQQLRTLLSAEQQRVQREERRGAQITAQAESLKKRFETLQALRSTESWSRLLRKIAAAAPPHVIVRRIDVVPIAAEIARPNEPAPKSGYAWRIEGVADRYEAVVDYQSRLRQLNEFEEVQLMRSGTQTIGATDVREFDFSCRRTDDGPPR